MLSLQKNWVQQKVRLKIPVGQIASEKKKNNNKITEMQLKQM